MILEIEKTLIEGAAAAGFAALLDQAGPVPGRQVGIVMSGGNIDMRLLSNVILRELTREGPHHSSVAPDRGPARASWRQSPASSPMRAAMCWKSPTTA